jgi:hypothetical protein
MSTDKQMMVIVNPAAEVEVVSMSMAPRLASLEGIRIGLVDNSKHMAAETLKALEEILRARGVASFETYRKDNPSVAMPFEMIAGMASRCDALVHGVAD